MTLSQSKNTLNCIDTLSVGEKRYRICNLKLAEKTLGSMEHMPFCLKIILENMLRHEDGVQISIEDIRALTAYHALQKNPPQVVFHPSHLVIGDEAGVSALTDIAHLAATIEPFINAPSDLASRSPLDIIIAQDPSAIEANKERYMLLKWAERNFASVRVVPPLKSGTSDSALASISPVIQTFKGEEAEEWAVPETVLGSQRNIPSLCHKGILGWQTNTLEVESLMLGHPLSFPIPPILGVKVSGKPRKGVGFSDIALTIMMLLRRHDARGKIVEFLGEGLDGVSAGDRAAIAQMAHYRENVLAVYFPIDRSTTDHLTQSGSDPQRIALIEAYAKAQGLWREPEQKVSPTYNVLIDLALDSVRPVVDYDHIVIQLSEVATVFAKNVPHGVELKTDPLAPLRNGDIVLASLGSAAAPPNPSEMVLAGLVAREAVKNGMKIKPWVRALMPRLPPSLSEHMKAMGLLDDLAALGFQEGSNEAKASPAVPLNDQVIASVKERTLTLCALGTEHPFAQEWAGYPFNVVLLASPALVILYAIAGSIAQDIAEKPLGLTGAGKSISFKDMLPSAAEIAAASQNLPCHVLTDMHPDNVFSAPPEWRGVPVPETIQALWESLLPALIRPPSIGQFTSVPQAPRNIVGARIWAIWGHEVQARWIAPDVFRPPAVAPTGNHERMLEGAFQNPALYNALIEAQTAIGGTRYYPSGLALSYADAALRYKSENTPMILVAGDRLGHGWGQEWAAKVLRYTGISVVIAQSYDPSFRLNLVRLGILPLQLKGTLTLADLNLTGPELLSVIGIPELKEPPREVMLTIERREDVERYMLRCCLETQEDYDMFVAGSLWALTAKAFIV